MRHSPFLWHCEYPAGRGATNASLTTERQRLHKLVGDTLASPDSIFGGRKICPKLMGPLGDAVGFINFNFY